MGTGVITTRADLKFGISGAGEEIAENFHGLEPASRMENAAADFHRTIETGALLGFVTLNCPDRGVEFFRNLRAGNKLFNWHR